MKGFYNRRFAAGGGGAINLLLAVLSQEPNRQLKLEVTFQAIPLY